MANNNFSFVDSIEGIEQLKSRDEVRSFALEESLPFILANLYFSQDKPIVYVSQTSDKARNLKNAVELLIGKENVILFPEPDQPFQHVIPDPLSLGQHIGALTSFITKSKPFLIISNDVLVSKMPNYQKVKDSVFQVSVGSSIKQIDLALKLEGLGFTPTYQVEMPGQFARRGEVFDIYPVTSDFPVRLDYFGNEIDEIRTFDPNTQRSLEKIRTVTIGPASSIASMFYENVDLPVLIDSSTDNLTKRLYAPYFNNDSIFSYIPESARIYCDDIRDIELLSNVYYDQMKRLQNLVKSEHNILYPEPVFKYEEIKEIFSSLVNIEFVSWKKSDDKDVIKLPIEHLSDKYYGINNWTNTAKELKESGKTLCVISHQAARLNEIISDENIFGILGDIKNPEITEHNITLFNAGIDGGFQFGDYYFITDRELFGVTKIYSSNAKRNVIKRDKSFDAEVGDYVVHIEHGIAKFAGTVMKSFNGAPKEYLKLQYANDDFLYVPMDQMDRVSRYIGSSQNAPALHKLGGTEWNKTQRKAKEAANEVAEELLNLYAEREIQTGFQFSKDNIWQMEMENSFPFTETPDQLQAIEDVKKDMASSKPMDRLICGDVGFGKTEVALRAAFKAVMDSKQVAILVPTTVLAQQHYNTFVQRLMAFPVKIKLLSRFVGPVQQKGIVEDIRNGEVDIVIGTHRLLSDDIHFKNLGLLIIDEEQRFGVEHKEYIKKMKSDVDVLTLSATPIPRTLQLSLTGVRHMSLIETPPEERIPIHTVVAEFDEQLVRNAIVNELSRGGQVYYVHNRVRSINNIAGKIQELVPDARIRVGHGQMSEEQLEQVMMDFVQHEFDVLVCTTIIESGVDVPNANTLIIDHADMFGLTQLYQIRGRVGRSSKLAYAYFLYEKDKILSAEADKRLQTLFEASELGSGMTLAMKDLEIRGAGNMLGTKQSGHIDSVGFNYYTQLLSEAVEDLRNKREAIRHDEKYVPKVKLPPPTIDLPILAFIPEDYISNAEQRVAIYKRMATCTELSEFNILFNEISDRFGEPPDEVKNLLFVVEMKIKASSAMIASITKEDTKVVLRRSFGITFNPDDELNKRRGVRVMLHQIQITYTPDPLIWQENLRYVLNELGPEENNTK